MTERYYLVSYTTIEDGIRSYPIVGVEPEDVVRSMVNGHLGYKVLTVHTLGEKVPLADFMSAPPPSSEEEG